MDITIKPNSTEFFRFMADADNSDHKMNLELLTPGAFRFMCDELRNATAGNILMFRDRVAKAEGYAQAAWDLGGDPDNEFWSFYHDFKQHLETDGNRSDWYAAFGHELRDGLVWQYRFDIDQAKKELLREKSDANSGS